MSFPRTNLVVLLAVAGVLVSSEASAFPQLQNSATPSLTLVVWDTTDKVTYFRDLGRTWSGATVGSDFASTLVPNSAADVNWGRFLTAIGGVSSTTFYDVVSGTLQPSGTQILVTTGGVNASGDPNTTLTAVKGPALQTAINSWGNFAANNAGTPGPGGPNFNSASGPGVVPNVPGSNLSLSGEAGEASTAPGWQNGFGQQAFTTFANVGQTMNFFSMSGGNAIANATVQKLPGQWLLDPNGTASYIVAQAAVPEPEAWVMLVAGLGVIAVVARRRLGAL